MTEIEQFKFGFLLRCADEGLSPPQIEERIKLASVIGGIGGAMAAGAKGTAGLLGAGLAGSALLGAGGGYIAAKAQEQQVDPEEAKQQELIAAFRQHAEQARRTAARIRHRMQQQRPRSIRPPRLLSA